MTFSERLQQLREDSKWTQAYVAERIGSTPQSIGHMENGVSTKPSASNLIKLSVLFGVDPGWLLTGEGQKIPVPGNVLKIVKQNEIDRLDRTDKLSFLLRLVAVFGLDDEYTVIPRRHVDELAAPVKDLAKFSEGSRRSRHLRLLHGRDDGNGK